jgi:hypothetical protein
MGDGYSQVLDAVRRKGELVEAGDWDGVAAVDAELERLRLTLPDTPPASARPTLEEAVRLNAAIIAAIGKALAGVQAELVGLGRERTAAAGYGAAGTPPLPRAAGQG